MALTISGTRLGTFRAWWLATVAFLASFMAGYDSGVAGGVLQFDSFANDFGYDIDTQKVHVNSLTVGLQNLGAFLSCFVIFIAADKLGRRTAIQIAAAVFMIGTIIETINTHSLAAWYVGRVIAGMGQGGSSAIVPIYSAEMAPKEIRGKMGSMYQMMYTIGIFTSYWIDYGVSRGISTTNSSQWQVPIGLQLVAGSLLFLGMFTLPESTRWLVKRSQTDQAWKALCWVRGGPSESVEAEFEELKLGIYEEVAATKDVSLKDLLLPVNRKGVGLGSALFIFQQGTGATALAYFGPQFFQALVGDGDRDLLITALFGAIKVVACALFILLLVENFSRRMLLTVASVMMGACMLSTALVVKYEPAPTDGAVTSSGIATVALIFINIAFYNFSWGPLPWAYVPEIFPTRTRAIGMATCVAVHWLFTFVFTFSTPYMLDQMGWGVFLFYAIFDWAGAVFCNFFMQETKNKSLEMVQVEMGGEKDTFLEKMEEKGTKVTYEHFTK